MAIAASALGGEENEHEVNFFSLLRETITEI